MSVPCATPLPLTTEGRHRRPRAADSRAGRAVAAAVTGVARLGSVVTLLALVVLGAAVSGLVDGTPSGADAVTVTFDDGR